MNKISSKSFPQVANPRTVAKQGFAQWPQDFVTLDEAERIRKQMDKEQTR